MVHRCSQEGHANARLRHLAISRVSHLSAGTEILCAWKGIPEGNKATTAWGGQAAKSVVQREQNLNMSCALHADLSTLSSKWQDYRRNLVDMYMENSPDVKD